MDFGLDDVERGLREAARAYLGANPGGRSWSALVGLGWFDPELPVVGRAVLAEECGHARVEAPWWPRLAMDLDRAGRTGIVWPADAAAPAVTPEAGLAGPLGGVPGLAGLDEVVVPVQADDGLRLLVVPVGSVRPARAGLDAGLDAGRLVGRLTGAGPAETLDVPDPAAWLSDVRRRGLVLLAAEAVGIARYAYETAAAHARDRVQFGRPIGSFQGVAFPVADAYVDLEAAWSLTYRAAWVVEQGEPGPEGIDEAVAAALGTARGAAVRNCERAVQIFGGAGMTWAHPIGPAYRRALWIQAFGPSTAALAAGTATALLGPARVA